MLIVYNCAYSLLKSKYNPPNIDMLPEVARGNIGLAISTLWMKNIYS